MVSTVSTGKAGPESRKLPILQFSAGTKGFFLILWGKASVRQHPKAVKMVGETTGGKLIFSCLEAPNESSGKMKKG